ncbi:MAG TPA: YfcE family phosphodiesterase [Desulfobacteraceae bacterium]|nr:YfcE family phosphodiesterase [Desulfobacteraceae bacterium]
MKIGVISDTHLQRISGEFEDIFKKYLADKDMILHAGDIVSEEVIDFLKGRTVHAVYGNMDPFEVQRRLPGKTVVEAGPYRIGLIHGWGPSAGLEDRITSEFSDVDAVVYGHSHVAANHVRDGVLYFNPGTATGYASSGIHSIGVLEVGDTITGRIILL